MGEGFVRDLRHTFPELDFRLAYTIEEQRREVADAEVQFGPISKEFFRAAKKGRPLCIIQNVNAREVIKPLKKDGWYIAKTKGDHKQLNHPTKSGIVPWQEKWV